MIMPELEVYVATEMGKEEVGSRSGGNPWEVFLGAMRND